MFADPFLIEIRFWQKRRAGGSNRLRCIRTEGIAIVIQSFINDTEVVFLNHLSNFTVFMHLVFGLVIIKFLCTRLNISVRRDLLMKRIKQILANIGTKIRQSDLLIKIIFALMSLKRLFVHYFYFLCYARNYLSQDNSDIDRQLTVIFGGHYQEAKLFESFMNKV